jgi:hypothetical protein
VRRVVSGAVTGIVFTVVMSCLPEDPGPASADAGTDGASGDGPSADAATDGGGADGPGDAAPNPFSYKADLDGMQTAIPNGHSGSGSFEGFLDTSAGRFCGLLRANYTGLAHIHEGAAGGTGTIVSMDDTSSNGAYSFDVVLSQVQRLALEGGSLYVDLHIPSGPTGIRAQIFPGGTKTSCP